MNAVGSMNITQPLKEKCLGSRLQVLWPLSIGFKKARRGIMEGQVYDWVLATLP